MENKKRTGLDVRGFFVKVGEHFTLYWKDLLVLLLGGGAIVALDQWTKALVRTHIPLGGDWLPAWLDWLMPYARVRHWHNSGAAFGMFQNGNLVFGSLAVIVAFVIAYYFPRLPRRDLWLRLALILQFAGAIGNLVDRVLAGRVTDFISVGNFAVFNVADASISTGVAVLVVTTLVRERLEKKQAASRAAGASSSSGQEGSGG